MQTPSAICCGLSGTVRPIEGDLPLQKHFLMLILLLTAISLAGCGAVKRNSSSNFFIGVTKVSGVVALPSELQCTGWCNGIWSTHWGDYKAEMGTSFATPYVSAAAGMLKAQGVSSAQIEQALTSTARPLGTGKGDPLFAAGLLDTAVALGSPRQPVSVVANLATARQAQQNTLFAAAQQMQVRPSTSKPSRLHIRVTSGNEARLRNALTRKGYQVKEHGAVWQLEGGAELTKLQQELQNEGLVEKTAVSRTWQAFAVTPNDPYYKRQWALPYGTFQQAWDQVSGLQNVTIAVLDSGVNFNHPDLLGIEFADRCSMIDTSYRSDDPQLPKGYLENMDTPRVAFEVKHIPPESFCWSANPQDDSWMWHGTMVTGILASTRGNGIGISGAGYGADGSRFKIMPVKVLDRDGAGQNITVAYGIYYAVDKGADVINLSLGGSPGELPTPEILDAIKYATDHGVVVVAATGNQGAAEVAPPANIPDVIGVGAATIWGTPASYSNYGPGLDLLAPGGGNNTIMVMVATNGPDGGYINAGGITLTDSQGNFEFPPLPAGDYRYFYAWIDTDLSGVLNTGDYYDVKGPLQLRKYTPEALGFDLHPYQGTDLPVRWQGANR